MIEKGTEVIWREKKYTVVNSFPLNETDFIYKFKGGNRWIEGKEVLPLKKRSKKLFTKCKVLTFNKRGKIQ